MSIFAHTDIPPVQETALIPNSVDWHIIAITICMCAALVCYGLYRRCATWIDKGLLPKKAIIVAELVGIALATAAGSVAGHLVWHSYLGALVGFVGGVAAPFFVKFLDSKLSIFFSTK